MISRNEIEAVVLEALERTNMARGPDEQLEVGPTAPLYGPDSPLDSLGLVALLIDIEEAFLDQEIEVSLSDERAMSQERSPYQDVPRLIAHIEDALNEKASLNQS